jgi:hypothetical protein
MNLCLHSKFYSKSKNKRESHFEEQQSRQQRFCYRRKYKDAVQITISKKSIFINYRLII